MWIVLLCGKEQYLCKDYSYAVKVNLTLFKRLTKAMFIYFIYVCPLYSLFQLYFCVFSSHGILSWKQSINRQSSENPCAREITGGSYSENSSALHG